MLILLAEYLQQYISAFAVFQYLTLRGILSVMTALLISLLIGPWVIRKLNQLVGLILATVVNFLSE